MKRFKLYKGNAEIFEITRENFENATARTKGYSIKGEDGTSRNFAICPACDNPIQLIGLYKPLKNEQKPYGKHYGRDTRIASHNERSYQLCPYARHRYQVTKESLKENITEFEKSIYDSVKEYFDLAVYTAGKDSGIYFSKKSAQHMLDWYLSSQGYLYYWATLYNIPWMLLYFLPARPCHGLCVAKGSELYEYFETRSDVAMQEAKMKNHVFIRKKEKYLNLYVSFLHHDRKVVDDEVQETLQLTIFSKRDHKTPKIEHKIILNINEYSFPNFAVHARFRNEKLLAIAEEMMPELDIDK